MRCVRWKDVELLNPEIFDNVRQHALRVGARAANRDQGGFDSGRSQAIDSPQRRRERAAPLKSHAMLIVDVRWVTA